MNFLQKQASTLLKVRGRWLYESNRVISAITEFFQDSLDELTTSKGVRAGSRASALIKLHWAACGLSRQATAERLEDDTRLLEYVISHAKDGHKLDPSLSELSNKEEKALANLVNEIFDALPDLDRKRLTDVRPVTGSLAKPPHRGGRFRKASALGVNGKLVETTGRQMVSRLLAAHG